jgi:hypothetical protein
MRSESTKRLPLITGAIVNKNVLASIPMAFTVTVATAQALATKDALIARAKLFELDTPYVAPPGDPLTHHAAGFAKVMCSAVFMTGLAPDFAAENVGFFTAPYAERAKLGKPVIDGANKTVHVTLPNGVTRTAKYLGSQGCVTLPIGQSTVNFDPVDVKSRLPDPATQPWPMGDMLPQQPLPPEIDAEKLKAAVNAAFQPADRRVCCDVERPTHCRALRGRYYGADAARRLVHGQERNSDSHWNSGQRRRL